MNWSRKCLAIALVLNVIAISIYFNSDPVQRENFKDIFGPMIRRFAETDEPKTSGRPKCQQQVRQSRMDKVCASLSAKPLSPGETQPLFSHLMVDEKSKAMYCYIPKAACSMMKNVLANFSGHNIPDRRRLHGNYINDVGIKFLKQYPENDAFKLLNDSSYLKFMVVRHPFDRLISAYIDKFVKGTYGHGYGRTISKHYNPNNSSGKATLEEFLRWQGEKYETFRDEHWQKYQELCQPCHVKYDVILKLETITADLEELHNRVSQHAPHLQLGKFKLPSVLNPSKNRSATSPARYLEDLVGISENVTTNLYQAYKTDFNLFGYSYDAKRNQALCGDNTDQCC